MTADMANQWDGIHDKDLLRAELHAQRLRSALYQFSRWHGPLAEPTTHAAIQFLTQAVKYHERQARQELNRRKAERHQQLNKEKNYEF